MKSFFPLFSALLVAFSLSAAACGQPVADPEVRKAQILANLQFEFPQLAQHSVVINEIEPSGTPGLDEGSFTINGQQTQPFLVTADNAKLYLLAADPVNVSRSEAEIAQAQSEREAAAIQAERDRAEELATAAAGLPVRGNPDAPVTIIEFSDFQCPYCARAAQTIEQLLEKRSQDIRFVYMHFPLSSHPWARPAAIAATCAAQQDPEAFWALHDQYFANQRSLTPGNVIEQSRQYLAGSGIDLETWAACASDRDSDAYQATAAVVDEQMALGSRHGVSGTPGFFVNGRYLNGAQPLEVFEAAIDEAN